MRVRRPLIAAGAVLLALACGAVATRAQEAASGQLAPTDMRAETLADIRAGMAALFGEVHALEAHLTPSGAAGTPVAGATALQRLDAIERELQRLIAKTEELDYRIRRVVEDGTARLGAIDRRLCALEGDCSGPRGQAPLGGGEVAPLPLVRPPSGPQLAVDERAALERGKALLSAGDFLSAAEVFAAHLATWPGGPLSTEAELLRGQALEGAGDAASAARAYLSAFSADKDGPMAAVALTGLGRSLAGLGQTREACAALTEVGNRFPSTAAAIAAAGARAQIACE